MDLGQELVNAVKSGIAKSVTDKLSGYQSPIEPMLKQVLEKHDTEIRELLQNAVSGALSSDEWRDEIARTVQKKLGKTLIERFGGEIEKQVNVLKSDPLTRAKIQLAIENIVKEHGCGIK